MSIALEYLHRQAQFDNAPFGFIHLAEGRMELCIYRDRRPLFFNTFGYETETDVVYHLLHTLELHGIDHTKVSISLAGQVSEDSEEFKMVRAYCPDSRLSQESAMGEAIATKDFIIANQYACG